MSDETSTTSERPALLEADPAAGAAAAEDAPRQEEQPAQQQPAEEIRSEQSRKEEAHVEQRSTTPPRSSGTAVWIALLISLAALAMAGWQWWENQQRAGKLQDELARRLSAGDSVSKESLVLSRQVQESLAALQGKVAALDARMTESQGQQATLEAMYQELSRGGDERVLAEIEQAVNLASQQLMLAGNVTAALVALQSADARLARAEQGPLVGLRTALGRDIERLKALPLVDVPGLALKIDSVVSAVDAMPLAFEARPHQPAAVAAVESVWWRKLILDVWQEIRQLVRVERLDRADPAVLSPQNSFILRENLKLRLVNARLALLQRDAKTYHEDIVQSRSWIERYFDVWAKPTQEALATLSQVVGAELTLEVPTLDDSLTALRNFKLGRDNSGQVR
jgi:uroporphyrin-3 C-methyltransferase